ncbi:MAG TPA: ASCH domain-containing protein [Nannocystaceae bacterium]|nr:ASCH domain-containing protein [Nannocystaceae bacterium]
MLLFKKPFWEGLQSGRITLTFRRWKSPHVKVGGRYRCHPIGVLQVDDVRLVKCRAITASDAERSGFASRKELLDYLAELGPLAADTEVYRVELHHGGDGDRVEIALDDTLDEDAIATIRKKLAKMDEGTPWTAVTLAIIERRPQVRAADLAEELGREKLELKADIRKLKRLGLTQSFEVGYALSPRGRAYLIATAPSGRSR